MKDSLNLIVMLTYNDLTIHNAYEIFEQCKNSKAKFWGFKEKPLSIEKMKLLYKYMKECNKTTFLEVVEYTEEKCLAGAKMAVECECDILMGTTFFDSVNEYCKVNNLKYMPFVGQVSERPSILNGTVDGIIEEAQEYIKQGVYGIDLLGYRYVGDKVQLNKQIVSKIHAPICIAGSIDSTNRLDEIKDANPWAFTIGSAFFNNKFGTDINEQIDFVCDYINK